MKTLKPLFDSNRAWATAVKKQDPTFFTRLSKQQSPEYLWIGCADSRIPATKITGMQPGELFVHRNIANLVVHTDLNCLSVIQYAVEVLGVKYIIVCGHYGCGGIEAALENQENGLIDNWLHQVKNVMRLHADELDGLTHDEQWNLLCELNVKEQVANVSNTTIVQNAWKQGKELTIHSWIYSIEDGLLRDLSGE